MRLAHPALLLAFCLTACQAPAPRSTATRASSAACRSEVNRVYAAQNRSELTDRDQRDTPLSGSYLSGITTRGLGAQYQRDREIESCLNASRGEGGNPAPGPASSPVAK